jgi:S-adenosylmethionine/arginine decarboxylase-like enzyme
VVVIAESHVAVHTWPEYGYAAVDIFTCGQTISPWDPTLSTYKNALKASIPVIWS